MCGGFLGDVFRIGTAVVAVAVAAVTLNPFAIVAAVGAVASVVGHYTGSKELEIGGTVLGAVGAVGGLANAAGIFELADVGLSPSQTGLYWGDTPPGWVGSAGGATGGPQVGLEASGAPSFAPGEGLGSAISQAGNEGINAVPNIIGELNGTASAPGMAGVEAAAAAPDVTPVAAVDGTVNPAPAPATASGQSTATLDTMGTPNNPPGYTNQTPGPGVQTPANASATETLNGKVGGVPVNVTGQNAPLDAASLINNTGNSSGIGIVRGASTTPSSIAAPLGESSSVFDRLFNFVSKPGVGTLAMGAMMAGGAFLSGATNSLTPAQINALNAQAEANQVAANLSRTQQNNMAQAFPVAHRTPAPTGMINTPKLAPVTGVPA